MWLFILLLAFEAAPQPVATSRLVTRAVSRSGLVTDHVIVGRTFCGEFTWLLNTEPALIRISPASSAVTVAPLRGLHPNDHVWGLACLADGTLWTLATPRVLARITLEGHVIDRVQLPQPWVALFAAGGRFLIEPPPIDVGKPVLATIALNQLTSPLPWPGLLTRPSTQDQRAALPNLLNCGLPFGGHVPCWFAADRRVSITDGRSPATSVDVTTGRPVGGDQSTPIWDVALAASGRMWVLRTSAVEYHDHRVADRISRWNGAHREDTSLDLRPPARLIVSANDESCLLLTAEGGLTQVAAR